MPLNEQLIKKINQVFEPSSLINLRFRSNDITLQTDENGLAIRLFIGTRNENGLIKGDRYSRTIIKGKEGQVLKDYWDRKGKATP